MLNVNELLYVNYNLEGMDILFVFDFGFVDIIISSFGYALSFFVFEDDLNVFDKFDVLDVCGFGEILMFMFCVYSDLDFDFRMFL